jgi:hypothetical protein
LRGFFERFSLGTTGRGGESGTGGSGFSFPRIFFAAGAVFCRAAAAGFASSFSSLTNVKSSVVFSKLPSAPLTSLSLAATPRSPSAAATRAHVEALCLRSASRAKTRPHSPHATRPTPSGFDTA